jgi:hypothetical protein
MVFLKTSKKLDKIAVSLIQYGFEPVQFSKKFLDKLDTLAAKPCWAWVSAFRRKWTFLDKTGHVQKLLV